MRRKTLVFSVIIFLYWLILANSCNFSPPSSTPDPELRALGEQFLVDHVGETYFQQHYRIETATRYNAADVYIPRKGALGADIVYYTFLYTYSPYIENYQFRFFIKADTRELWVTDFGVTGQQYVGVNKHVLLEPQEFAVSPEQAVEIALANGVAPLPEELNITTHLHSAKNELPRFCWRITNPNQIPDHPDFAYSHCQYVVYVDVETGIVHTSIGCMDTQE